MLELIEEEIQAAGKGCGGQTELARSALAEDFIVQFPESLAEQQQIVGVLDEAFDGIASAKTNAEQNIRNARALLSSERDHLLSGDDSWCERAIGDLCEIRHGYAFQSQYFKSSGDLVLLTPGNFFETGGYRDRGLNQKFFVGSFPEQFVLQAGDLLVAMTEQAAGLLGSPLRVPGDGRFLHNQRLGRVVAKQSADVDLGFLFHVFNSEQVRSAIQRSATGVKVRHTSPGRIGGIGIKIPRALAAQQEVASKLDACGKELEKLSAIYERKLDALDVLKKALLHEVFSGQP